MTEFKPEVLSPARNLSSVEAAVRSGADAVYLGSTKFSARQNAENFTDDELEKAIKYCHIRGVKVYLALNTMIKNREMKDAFETAKRAYLLGIDAVIISDLGLSRLIKEAMPDLELHASTQMTLHSPFGLEILKDLGFKRVVAAREMSKENLTAFCKRAKELGLETEVFVHGALCMSVSGQCLLSSVLGARSGNRGLCAGPCRLPFRAKKGTGFDLSLKDLSLLNHIEELRVMGVNSLKIEGRMKRPEYISASTYAFRTAVDTGFTDIGISNLLEDVFSRSGFTDGYYINKPNRDMFGIRTEENAESSKEAFSKIHEFYRKELQRVAVYFKFEAKKGKPISLTASDTVNSVTVFGGVPDISIKRETEKELVLNSLKKTGNTPYLAKEIDITLDCGLFISTAAVNSLKNDALKALSEKRGRKPERAVSDISFDIPKLKQNHKNELYARFINGNNLPENISELSGIILPLEAEIPDNLPKNIKLIAEMPRWIEKEIDFTNKGFTHALCGNLAGIELAKKAGLKIIASNFLNTLNDFSFLALEDLGCEEIILSAETEAKDIPFIKNSVKKGIFAYGRLPLMLMKNCPLKNGRSCKECDKKGFITDRTNTDFPIRCRKGIAELLNSKPLYIADKLNEFYSAEIKLLYFTTESREESEKIIRDYLLGNGTIGEFTRGLYYKNLK